MTTISKKLWDKAFKKNTAEREVIIKFEEMKDKIREMVKEEIVNDYVYKPELRLLLENHLRHCLPDKLNEIEKELGL